MNISKYIAFAAVAAVATGAFADAANTLVKFSTNGDYYADGTPVVNGEWYACCWSADGIFEGITTDYKPLDPNDKIFLKAPLAKNGKCPSTTFQIKSEVAPTSGKYCVILLDTREGGKPAGKKDGKLIPDQPLNAAIASATYTIIAANVGSTVGAQTAAVNPGWGVTDPQPTEPAKIASIDPAGDDVVIEIVNLYPGVRYDLKAGSEPTKLTTYALEAPVEGSKAETATVILPKEEAHFYKLIQAPMSK